MSKENTIVAKLTSDGTLVQVLPDGTTRPLPDRTDWARLDAMTEEEIHAAAMADPDARPMTPEQMAKARRVPRVETLRRARRVSPGGIGARGPNSLPLFCRLRGGGDASCPAAAGPPQGRCQ